MRHRYGGAETVIESVFSMPLPSRDTVKNGGDDGMCVRSSLPMLAMIAGLDRTFSSVT